MPEPVLFLIQHLHRGGTEDHFHDLVTGLDRTVIEPHVIHFNDLDGHVAGKLAAQEWLPKQFTPVSRAYNLSGLRAIRLVRRAIRERNIAAVVTFHFVADFIGALAAWGSGRPVVSSRRDMGFTRTPRQFTLGRWLSGGVARYIAVSEAVREAVARDEHIDPNRIDVINNGIDLAEFDAQHFDLPAERARLGIAPDELVVGCVANFNLVKGHLTLLDAFARLRALCPDVPLRLLLAGEGPVREAIEAKVAALDLQQCVLLAGLSKQVAREFQLSDIVVLASETEGFSNSIVQAMACRKPVVACRVGGNPEAVADGETGLLVEPKNPEALARAITRLIHDPALRRQMGEAARQRVERRFTRDVMIKKTQDLLLRVIHTQ